MLKEISLKDALLAFAGHRDVIVLMDVGDNDPQITKLDNLIDLLFSEKYHFMFDDGEMLDDVGSAEAEETPAPEKPVTKKARPERKKIPQVVKKVVPKEEEPFDYGKLGALIRAGKPIEFLQQEYGCTRAQIAARIRIWNKMEEEKKGVDTSDTGSAE